VKFCKIETNVKIVFNNGKEVDDVYFGKVTAPPTKESLIEDICLHISYDKYYYLLKTMKSGRCYVKESISYIEIDYDNITVIEDV